MAGCPAWQKTSPSAPRRRSSTGGSPTTYLECPGAAERQPLYPQRVTSATAPLTASQVNKAGKTLRRWIRGEDADSPQNQTPSPAGSIQIPSRITAAVETLIRFRAAHAAPLVTANNGLRSMVRSEGCQVEVSQRLKRIPTILDKLTREPTLALARMQDLGGCRAILNSIDEVRRVQARLVRRRPVMTVSDYIASPRMSGYRGVHVVVVYGGRCIEVQLRTRVMHEWAYTVERLQGRLTAQLKSDGDHPVQQLMSVISLAMALEETGSTVGPDLVSEIARLKLVAQPYLSGGGER